MIEETMTSRLTQEARDFLAEPRFAVLATINPDGTPQQTVMWYKLRGDTIVMNTAAGRLKDHNVRRDNRVSVCVEDGYRFITIRGAVELISDQETAQADILSLAKRYHPDRDPESFTYFRHEQRETLLISLDHVLEKGLEG